MHERILDVIVWTVSQLKHNDDIQSLEQLTEKGFTKQEISIAFSWIAEQFENKKPNELIFSLVKPSDSFRIFSEEEKKFFTEEAYTTILKLLSLDIIRPDHIEYIIEKANDLSFKKITDDMVRQFVAHYMFELDPSHDAYTRYSLSGNESIN